MTGLTITGDTVTLPLLLPPAPALTDAVFIGAVLVVMATLLVSAGRAQDRLVTALRDQARADALTGLVNRRVFDEALASSAPGRDTTGTALVLIDVDSFTTINDSHGHRVGDQALVHLARLLRDLVRAEDAVLSRLGGDELAVLLPGCGAAVAARRAEDPRTAVRYNPPAARRHAAHALDQPGRSAPTGGRHRCDCALLGPADRALYQAKRAVRGRVAVTAA